MSISERTMFVLGCLDTHTIIPNIGHVRVDDKDIVGTRMMLSICLR